MKNRKGRIITLEKVLHQYFTIHGGIAGKQETDGNNYRGGKVQKRSEATAGKANQE